MSTHHPDTSHLNGHAASEGRFQTTLEGTYSAVDLTLARIYGYASPEELMNSISDIARQLYLDPGRRKEFARLIQKHGSVTDFESPIRRKDGEIIWISENARELRDHDGELLGYEGSVTDITARKSR